MKVTRIQLPETRKANQKLKVKLFVFLLAFLSVCYLLPAVCSFGQDTELEFNLDASANTVAMPKIFRPSVDLSGRGFNEDRSWPQELAAPRVIGAWGNEIGFKGLYRLQYNLWGISNLAKDKAAQEKMLSNYDEIIKKISDAGGTVILDIFSTPPGLGKVLDKKSSPWDFKAFKELVKGHIRQFSCNKKYNIWYEVWSAPDLDGFFLGRKQEYLDLYKAVAEGIKELEAETKMHIAVGGPSASWWFQNFDGNTIITPEKSLIYELLKFCSQNKLPLDFISWHAYSTDPNTEEEMTAYNKTPAALIREWLTYFNFSKDTPLLVSEWNYDRGNNVLSERKETSFICSSYIVSRIARMYKSGIDAQLFFSLEDFQGNQEGVMRNVGVFWFEPSAEGYNGGHKSMYNVFKMLNMLGENMVAPAPVKPTDKPADEFVKTILTKDKDYIAVVIYNYIDSEISTNYLTRNIAVLNNAERQALLELLKQDAFQRMTRKELDEAHANAYNKYGKVHGLLKRAKELNDLATKNMFCSRNIKLTIKNLFAVKASEQPQADAVAAGIPVEKYLYQRYTVDSACSINCEFVPAEEKEISLAGMFQQSLTINPYSVNLIILRKKPKEPEPPPQVTAAQETPAVAAAGEVTKPDSPAVAPATGQAASGAAVAQQGATVKQEPVTEKQPEQSTSNPKQ